MFAILGIFLYYILRPCGYPLQRVTLSIEEDPKVCSTDCIGRQAIKYSYYLFMNHKVM